MARAQVPVPAHQDILPQFEAAMAALLITNPCPVDTPGKQVTFSMFILLGCWLNLDYPVRQDKVLHEHYWQPPAPTSFHD